MAAYNNGFPMSYPQMAMPQMVPQQMYYQQQYATQPPMMQQGAVPAQTVQPNVPAQPPVQPMQQVPQQIQNGGFVQVHGEMEARNYPVAPGNSVTFKDDSAPYCYVKTMSYNQFDNPQFVKYRLVREEDSVAMPPEAPQNVPAQAQTVPVSDAAFASQEDFDAFRGDVSGEIASIKEVLDAVKEELAAMAGQAVKRAVGGKTSKKEVESDD